jgi:glycosyltransferase involved in cell wall biosynthesis
VLIFTHPTGNANVRHAALGLHRAGLLGEFWTCLNHRGKNPFARLLPPGVRAQLARRSFADELQPAMRAHPWREAARLVAHRAGLASLARHETGPLSVDAVYQSLDRRVARRVRGLSARENPAGVYAYEDGAAYSFREARRRGLKTFYDLPIGYWRAARAVLIEEAEREPGWASTLIGNGDSPAKTARKDEELALADRIYVASSYTLKTLDAAPGVTAPIEVIPYGAPARPASAPKRVEREGAGPLRVIFVGSLGQRKGLSYLFAACRALGPAVELTVIGTLPLQPCAALETELRRARVRWIPSCPHAQVLAEMAAHDVFVFPSLFEGFGLVLLEAMAMGLPIIATPHTAAPDLIDDGQEGFLVPIRSAEAIAEKLERLHRDRALVNELGARAAIRAAGFTWETYGARLAASVAGACQGSAARG